MATSYHGIGSRVKHSRTRIDIRPLTVFMAWTYPVFEEVACAFLDPERCPSKV